jgi:hypothetical protein
MRASELGMTLAEFTTKFESIVADVILAIAGEYTADALSNEAADVEFRLTEAEVEYTIYSRLKTMVDTRHKALKERMDDLATRLELAVDVDSGSSLTVHSSRVATLVKRRNVATLSVPMKDFVIELRKQGVDSAIIDKANTDAATEKRGSLYYDVSLLTGE